MAIRATRRGVLLVILLIAPAAGGGPASGNEPPAGLPADLTARVDDLFAEWNRPDRPGCAVGIVHRGRLIYSKGFGSANLEYRAPNTPRTVFEVMSFSKSITCACLALLMDEGKIAPDDDLRKFVPEMHAFDPPIRIQDMVRCRSGLWDQISLPVLVGWENAPLQHPHTEADFFALITGQKTLPFRPGSQYRYSSGDYFLLGIIVKRISGQSLPEFARRRIFEPLGMTRTFFEEDPTRVVEHRAVGHYKRVGDAWHLWRQTAYFVGGASLWTCVEDLFRWDQNFAHNRLPKGKYIDKFFREGTLLENRSVLDLDAALKEDNPQARSASPPGLYRGLRRRQFTGGAWGMNAAMSQFPDREFTVICLSNNDDIASWEMNRRIADLALGDRLRPRASTPARAASELPTVELKDADLRDKVGAYRLKRTRLIWRVTLQDRTLRLTGPFGATCRLRPVSATRFDPEGPGFPAGTRFVFAPAAAGSPRSLTSQSEDAGRREWETVEMVDPTPAQLEQYAGRYESDELAATYRLAVRDGRLWLRVNSRRWEPLDATVRDEFVHVQEPADARIITFLRGEKGDVTGFSIDYYRVTGVRFTKR
jgi:CubicO group peptidase (beta-lactamase class C family)